MQESQPAKTEPKSLVRVIDEPPVILAMVILEDLVPFPGQIVPILLGSNARKQALRYAKSHHGFLLLINRKSLTQCSAKGATIAVVDEETHQALHNHSEGEPAAMPKNEDLTCDQSLSSSNLHLKDLHNVGVVARLVKVLRLHDDNLTAFVHTLRRAQPLAVDIGEEHMLATVGYLSEQVVKMDDLNATFRQLRLTLRRFFEAHPSANDELKMAALAIENPNALADFVAQHLSRDFDERLWFLAQTDAAARVQQALEVAIRELDLLQVGNRISQKIRDRVEKNQRDFLLREQLKAIRVELGDEKESTQFYHHRLLQKLKEQQLPAIVRTRVDEERQRLEILPIESPEYHVVQNYLEWVSALPWGKYTATTQSIVQAQAILESDHYGLCEVKERIAQFLAVQKLNPQKQQGTLLCFAGPPGVGKTSLGRSIAKAVGRQFYRFSVGGMRDESEIKGHRRTYIGAMPGRIVQVLKQVQTFNPVIMLDELDKMNHDFRGDPSSSLLEVLDPVQNQAFVDYYLDLPLDLSKVMFIATVNMASDIPYALRDRLEIIELPGYISEEKVAIAKRYLLPRQRCEHGLKVKDLRVNQAAIQRMISAYTHEAGVRELGRLFGKLCRQHALTLATRKTAVATSAQVSPGNLVAWLGPPKIHDETGHRRLGYGIALGLAWTPVGGEVLYVEAVKMPGKGQLKITGQLGQVMNESADIAMSYVRKGAKSFGIAAQQFEKFDFHLHFPAGAVKKDGPSAGVVATTALLSLLCEKPLRTGLAMTGEMTLSGKILPVGGVCEKVIAAQRAGLRTVILPERNRADASTIPAHTISKLKLIFVASYSEILRAAFPKSQIERAV